MTGVTSASTRAEQALEEIAIGSVAVTTRALLLSGIDLSFTQWRVLVIAGDRPDGVAVSEIAARLGAEISPASRLIRRMAARGYVGLSKDESDRRVTRVGVTEAGRALRDTVLERRRGVLAGIVVAAQSAGLDLDALERVAAAFAPFI
jgi:DNA-binding MarR family transcriptional regulator